ncbi:DNA-directed RNA polymerase subunit beta [Cohnella sp. CFH 77786]|uniref:DNA-directed RNA polymerase subunit beta n=1 Tax=Cohnella sp. CFH 77786 TaxID=2662265 RepID=UPI001C60C005|nr:DNA-directed RNA polymerase subunit beta [Cohnella sp. CFH 77786]MBW5445906.1 DNA-directed RNA polymerase subunit beta [Cohnella sp. CFH 77786]
MTASPRPTVSGGRSAGRTIGRILWITFKVLIIPGLCVLALIVGLAAGYAVLGGRPVSEVFEIDTWKHMYDLVFADG